MWTAGFPEPKTFSKRAARLLRGRRADFDIVHDNQVLGYGMLDIRSGVPADHEHPPPDHLRSPHRPRGRDQAVAEADPTALVRLPADAGQGGEQAGEILTVSESQPPRHRARTSSVDDARRRGDPARGSTRCSAEPTTPRVPGRLVAMASADAPMKGIATLLEAFAKLRHRARRRAAPGHQADTRRQDRAADRPARHRRARSASSTASATRHWSR